MYENGYKLGLMYKKRIIPCLDIKNGRVVKGINFVHKAPFDMCQ